jgi:ABC-type polysaccharide/polyol phosphate export permease
VLPLVPLASAFLNQLILFVITAVLMAANGIGPASSAWLFVVVWAIAVMLTVGLAFAVSAVALYVPDLAQIVPVGVNILFWLTPILYPATLVETQGALWVRSLIMEFNPFSYIVEMSRQSVFGTSPVALGALAGLAVFALVVLGAGLLAFRKLKSGFADVL